MICVIFFCTFSSLSSETITHCFDCVSAATVKAIDRVLDNRARDAERLAQVICDVLVGEIDKVSRGGSKRGEIIALRICLKNRTNTSSPSPLASDIY